MLLLPFSLPTKDSAPNPTLGSSLSTCLVRPTFRSCPLPKGADTLCSGWGWPRAPGEWEMCVGPEDEVGHHWRSVQAFGEDTGENGLECPIAFGILSTHHRPQWLIPQPGIRQTWDQAPLCSWEASGKLLTLWASVSLQQIDMIVTSTPIGWLKGAEPLLWTVPSTQKIPYSCSIMYWGPTMCRC